MTTHHDYPVVPVLRKLKVLSVVGAVSAVCLALSACAPGEPTVDTADAPARREVYGCQPHVELQGAAFWARDLHQSEEWVLANHRISLWDGPDTRQKVGEVRVGSRAVILDSTDDAYRVRSPLDGSDGWVSTLQVARTLHQDVETQEPCVGDDLQP